MTAYATISETAQILGIPRGAVRSAIRRGKILIKKTAGGTSLVILATARKWKLKDYNPPEDDDPRSMGWVGDDGLP